MKELFLIPCLPYRKSLPLQSILSGKLPALQGEDTGFLLFLLMYFKNNPEAVEKGDFFFFESEKEIQKEPVSIGELS